jgi:predicted phage terminase large subunit-like protein
MYYYPGEPMMRTKAPRKEMLLEALKNPRIIQRELNNRSLYHFLQYFWPLASAHDFSPNWHIELLCKELEMVAERVALGQPKEYDLVINVPPGSTKTITCSIMFPVWCWTKWHWMRFITASYSSTLSLESAEFSRDIIRSALFQEMYPELDIKADKDTKSNFKLVKKTYGVTGRPGPVIVGGNRYSTSVLGTLTGFHGDILIIDDPLNPTQAFSDTELMNANRWCEQTLSTRKTRKAVTPTIYIMQRLHQDDPSGHLLAKNKTNVRHISLPGECRTFQEQVKPAELLQFYKDDLMDPNRMPWSVLKDMEADLGQYGYAGQVGQNPTPPGGGMFKVDHFIFLDTLPMSHQVEKTVRYWDKAASKHKDAAFTCGVRMSRLNNGCFLIEDVIRGQWETHQREAVIRETAEADGGNVEIWIEQEPGSGGKDSAKGTILNLAGFKIQSEKVSGDKESRADAFSVQVNNGHVFLVKAGWNQKFIEEYRFFPASTFKDQVDAGSGAFNKLLGKKRATCITKRLR